MQMHTDDPEIEAQIAQTLAAHPGLTREKLLNHLQREETMRAVNGAPFPGPLRDGFAGNPRTVLGYTLQPVSLALLCALERIESPFIPMVEIIGKYERGKDEDPAVTNANILARIEKQVHPTTESLIATVYCFVTDIDTVEAELDKGIILFRRHAKKTIGRAHHPRDLATLNVAILEWYVQSFSTVVDYRARKMEGDNSFPSAPAERTTASAGASTCAEPSCGISE